MQKTDREELKQVEQKIEDLLNSEEYKDLANKNRAWAQPKPTEQQQGEWKLLQEQLTQLREDKHFWQNAILNSKGTVEPGSQSAVLKPETDAIKLIEQKIEKLINSEEYKDLANKNRAWAQPKPTEQQQGEWKLLQEQLTQLKKKEEFWQNAILTSNTSHMKKQDSVRKGYKKEIAAKSQRALLTSIANHLYSMYDFKVQYDDPTFGDVMYATEFKSRKAIRDYFLSKKKAKEIESSGLKDCYTEEEWTYLVDMNHAVNYELHSNLKETKDGTTVVVLQENFYKAKLVTKIMVKTGLVEDADHLDVKNAESDSTNHSGSSKGGSPTDKKVTS